MWTLKRTGVDIERKWNGALYIGDFDLCRTCGKQTVDGHNAGHAQSGSRHVTIPSLAHDFLVTLFFVAFRALAARARRIARLSRYGVPSDR